MRWTLWTVVVLSPLSWLLQLDAPNAGNCIVLNNQLVAVGCRGADIGLGIELVPGPQPGGHGVVLGSGHIDVLDFLQRCFELFLDLRLSFAQHVLDEPFAGLGIVPGGVASFPAAIFPLSDISFSVGPLLCHLDRLLCNDPTYHNFLRKARGRAYSYQTVINLLC